MNSSQPIKVFDPTDVFSADCYWQISSSIGSYGVDQELPFKPEHLQIQRKLLPWDFFSIQYTCLFILQTLISTANSYGGVLFRWNECALRLPETPEQLAEPIQPVQYNSTFMLVDIPNGRIDEPKFPLINGALSFRVDSDMVGLFQQGEEIRLGHIPLPGWSDWQRTVDGFGSYMQVG